MRQDPSRGASRPRGALAVGLAALAVALSGVVAAVDLQEPAAVVTVAVTQPAPPAPAPTPTPTPSAAPVVPTSPPVELRIPDLGIAQNLIGLRIAPDGTLQVPTDFNDVGWFSQGFAPGDAGPAVLAGHVDSKAGPAVFYELDTLVVGDLVQVRRADGSLRTYAVTDTRSVLKDEFPTDFVYASTGAEELKLITCGGVFDRSSGHYLNNTIVTAVPVPESEQGVPV